MNLLVFEQDKVYVQECLENGDVDYVEAVSEASETDFFKYINERGFLQKLADSYPFRREKEEVPMWLYIASDLSLRLHGMQSFHSYPFVIRTGGLMNALGPMVGRKVVHPQTGDVTLYCPGFNSKNKYDRQTPCDQDWLRKIARATEADKLLAWHNREVPQLLKDQGLFDPEGIFIGDASYVFVPDNEHYENSVVMLFDEHNHPVKKEELSPERLRRCSYKRCYKWVELIHTNASGDFFYFVAMRLGPGNEHECPILYSLVEDFLNLVGKGVMKWLLVDRGFLDGARIGHLKRDWNVDVVSGLKSDMAVLEDARGLLQMGGVEWQDYHPRQRPEPPTPPKPESVLRRERSRQQRLKKEGRWPEPRPPEKVVAINDLTSWDACAVPLTVVLTQKKDEEPWGLVATSRTEDAGFVRDMYHVREAIEERHRQTKLFWDLTGFHSPNFNLVTNQVVFVALAYTFLQIHLLEHNRPELNRTSLLGVKGQLLPYGNHIVVYYRHYFGFFSTPEYTGIILDIVEPGKSKLRRKMRRLQREFLHELKHPREP